MGLNKTDSMQVCLEREKSEDRMKEYYFFVNGRGGSQSEKSRKIKKQHTKKEYCSNKLQMKTGSEFKHLMECKKKKKRKKIQFNYEVRRFLPREKQVVVTLDPGSTIYNPSTLRDSAVNNIYIALTTNNCSLDFHFETLCR